jgi:glutaredoxin 3
MTAMAPIDIYTIRYCPYCQDAKELLSRKGVIFHEIDVTGNRDLRKAMIARANGRATYPQIFIGTTHVGGCDDLYALEEAGQLDPLLAESKEMPQQSSKQSPAKGRLI